jgi:ABC-type multidrug transport system fused ATPase/permease subunit
LLTLLDKPTSGEIYINDVKASDYDTNVLRANMSVLFQDFSMAESRLYLIVGKYFMLTTRENIGIGNAKLMDDFNLIRKAAIDSGAHEYISKFESYYQTTLQEEYTAPEHHSDYYSHSHFINSRTKKEIPFLVKMLSDSLLEGSAFGDKKIDWFPKPPKKEIDIEIPEHKPSDVAENVESRSLSGGQWQRIALGRAFLKIIEADLLVLDEPSSALDPQAEYEVFKTIMELRKGRTTIYIVYSS